MKKVFQMFIIFTVVLFLGGCEKAVPKQGEYKEGTYMGSVVFESYSKKYVTTAVIYVDEFGMLKSCFIDSTYIKDGVNTTKKTLKDDYGMKATSASVGTIPGGAEWYEQVKVIEDKVIEEQGLSWVKWSSADKTKLDAISGVTITADSYINAVSKALEQAK